MFHNGISHITVGTDLEGIEAIVRWLSFVPKDKDSMVPIFASKDPIEREVEYKPTPLPYDPRWMLEGTTIESPENGKTRLSGFFDEGTWTETLAGTHQFLPENRALQKQLILFAFSVFPKTSDILKTFLTCLKGWAKNVVVGRARLGGIPVGVLAVEPRTTEVRVPADPASLDSQEVVCPQAGLVWFPNSAFKTAQVSFSIRKEKKLKISNGITNSAFRLSRTSTKKVFHSSFSLIGVASPVVYATCLVKF